MSFLFRNTSNDFPMTKEYRVLVPGTLKDYKIGSIYTMSQGTKQTAERSGGKDTITTTKIERYEDSTTGRKGIYTFKIYRLDSYTPNWVRAILPDTAMRLEEECWDCYPYVKTRISSPFLGERFFLQLETIFLQDAGTSENAHNLPAEHLKKRTVEVLDFVNQKVQDKRYNHPDEDPLNQTLQKYPLRGLKENWLKTCPQIMCAYKLVTTRFRYPGFQNRVEAFIIDSQRDMMLRFQKLHYKWSDEWWGMTLEEVRGLEMAMSKIFYEEKLYKDTKEEEEDGPAPRDIKEEEIEATV